MTGIVVDLAPHPLAHYAVVIDGQLVPIRFSRREEAGAHLGAIVAERSAKTTELAGAAA